MSFTIYPAIDVRDGRVVRLAQGDYALETRYATDPFNLAMAHADAGAQWLHLVDLDAARTGGYALLPLLRAIAADGRLQVQSGGGVRSDDDVRRMFDAGAARVVVGSLAVIGLADGVEPVIYSLTSQDSAGVVPAESDQQILTSSSFAQQDGISTLTFTVPLDTTATPFSVSSSAENRYVCA